MEVENRPGSGPKADDPEKQRSSRSRDERVKELCNDSGISAIGKAASASNKVVMMFWLILLLAAIVGCFFTLYFNFARYMAVPVLTQLNREFGKFQWPHMTFCNPSNPIPFWTNRGLKDKWDALGEKAAKLPPMVYQGGKDVAVSDLFLRMFSLNPQEFYKNNLTSSILSLQVRLQSSEILTSSGDFDQFQRVRNFKIAFDDVMASSKYPIPCVTLKPERLTSLLDVNDPSDFFSIKITLIQDFWSYETFNSGFENRKTYLYFTNPNAALKTGQVYYIYSGTTNNFEVTQRHFERIRDCNALDYQVDIYDATMTKSSSSYGNYDICREYASQVLFTKKCSCQNPFLSIYKFYDTAPKLCLNMTLYDENQLKKNLECLNNVKKKYSIGDKFKRVMERTCLKYKKPLCYKSEYTFLTVSNDWKPDMNENRKKGMARAVQYLPNNQLGKNVKEDFAIKNMATIKITRAPGLTVSTYEVFEYPLSQLLSDVGGTLGLWLGISVISIFEILEFSVLLCREVGRC